MKATLQIIDGPLKGRFIPLVNGKATSIGSSADADYPVHEDVELASRHFAIALQDEACILQDLVAERSTSVNDTFVKGKIVLKDGDVIRASTSAFKVRFMSLSDAISFSARQTIEDVSESTSNDPTETSISMDIDTYSETAREGAKANSLLEDDLGPDMGKAVRLFRNALRDSNTSVRKQALEAAVWTRQPWLISYLCQCCQQLSLEFFPFYEMLAILSGPENTHSILRILKAEHLGPERLRIAGMYGHPACLEFLLPLISSRDKRTAVEAARSFTKISGQEIDSDLREPLPPKPGSHEIDLDDAIPDEATLPDHVRATDHMKRYRDKYNQGTRWCRGIDISKGDVNGFEGMDQESSWEARMRSHFSGRELSHPYELIRFRAISIL